MLKIKYSDEKYLCKYDLDMRLFDNLGIDIIDLWPTRNIYVLDTKQGKKILKMIDYSDDRLNFICKSIDYIKKSYNNVLTINTLPNEKKYIEWNGDRYILLDLIEGVECGIANPVDLEVASKGIALMHNASVGLANTLSRKELENNSGLLKLPQHLEGSKKDLILFKNQVSKYIFRNEFDDLFMEEVDYHIAKIEKCEELLNESSYEELCKDVRYIALCHNDLAYHNIILNEGLSNFIDFDYCEIDLRIKDIWNFIIKAIKKFGFSLEICDSIIKNYNEVYQISKKEYELLYIYFTFPSDFYTISKEYYLKLKNWSYESYLSKFENKLEYTKEKELLLSHLKENYINK